MNADTARAQPTHRENAQHGNAAGQFTIRLSATPRGARLARRLAAGQLDGWGWPYDTEANHTATLLVAELATNAVRHGRVKGRDFRMTLSLYRDDPVALRIELTDPRTDRRPPTPGTLPPASPETEAGRGLLLVDALASHWGTTCADPYTKTVWCEVILG
ncbi:MULTISPECIES: ATP-binding protein [Streptomyces]|uniref:ATP-binding protein n=1 Tax=Streptomyces rochei TaxID=1928 RepID=A0ABW7EAE7_STRRO|nr:ATP-binding protein [Streptomyces sp. MBT28]